MSVRCPYQVRRATIVAVQTDPRGTLRSNDVEGNENAKKTIGSTSKTTTLHVHHVFFFFFTFLCPFLHDYDVKMPNFAFYGGHTVNKQRRNFISLF